MNILVTRNNFLRDYKDYRFTEYKTQRNLCRIEYNLYRIEYSNSFLKCVIQKNETGVHIIYLDSQYESIEHKMKLIQYATFVIAYRENDNRDFETIEFNDNGEIITI